MTTPTETEARNASADIRKDIKEGNLSIILLATAIAQACMDALRQGAMDGRLSESAMAARFVSCALTMAEVLGHDGITAAHDIYAIAKPAGNA